MKSRIAAGFLFLAASAALAGSGQSYTTKCFDVVNDKPQVAQKCKVTIFGGTGVENTEIISGSRKHLVSDSEDQTFDDLPYVQYERDSRQAQSKNGAFLCYRSSKQDFCFGIKGKIR